MLVFYSKHNVSGWKSSPCKVGSTTCAFLSVIIYRIPKNKTFYDEPLKKRHNKLKTAWHVTRCEVFYKYVGGLYF